MRLLLFLFRHGSTLGNLEKRYIGETDEPLCDEGRKEVKAERERILGTGNKATQFFSQIISSRRKVFSSPLSRARETAGILFPDNPIQIESGLTEMHFGLFEGKNADEMFSSPKIAPLYQFWIDSGCLTKCADGEGREGESKAEFSERVCAAFLEFMGRERFASGEVVPIVCHGGTINSLLERFAVTKKGYFDWRTAHADYRLEEIEI